MDESEHIGCDLAQVFVCDDFGNRNVVREPIDGEGIPDSQSAWDIAFMAAIVLSGRSDVPAINTMRCHIGSLLGYDEDDDLGAGWSEKAFVEVVILVEADVFRELGLTTGGAKKI